MKTLSTFFNYLLIGATALAFMASYANAADKSYSEYRAQYEKGIQTLHENSCYNKRTAEGIEHTTAMAMCFDVRRHVIEAEEKS